MNFKLNNETVKITANSVECRNSCIQIEMVKMLVECRGETKMGESPLPLLFNRYLRFMDLTNIEFIEIKEPDFAEYDEYFANKIISKIAA